MPFVPAVLQPAVLSDRPLWFVVQGSGIVLRAYRRPMVIRVLPTDQPIGAYLFACVELVN
jgi:hypothetical protein